MGYQKQAILGFSWQTAQKLFATGISVLKIFILARLLTPEQFGLFSLIMITLGTTESFTQTGVNTTMLQSKQAVHYFLDTAFVISIIRGFIIASLMIVMGYFMAAYYDQAQLFPMITIASLVPLIKGFINPAIVSWQKNFAFSKDSLYASLRLLFEAIAQVSLALWLHSVWALVFGVILAAAFEVLLSFVMLRERPVFHYIKSRGALIFQNARWLSLSSLLNYLNDNIDDFLIGKIAGTHKLGIYHNAYSLSHKVNYDISKSAYHGVMPIFTKMTENHDKPRLKRAFYKAVFTTLLIGGSLSLPLLLFPELLIKLLLGEQWLEASEILRLLTVAGLIQAVSNLSYALLIAKKQYLYMNLHLFSSLLLVIIFILTFGQSHGLVGAVVGIVLARVLTLPIALYGAKKSLE